MYALSSGKNRGERLSVTVIKGGKRLVGSSCTEVYSVAPRSVGAAAAITTAQSCFSLLSVRYRLDSLCAHCECDAMASRRLPITRVSNQIEP